MSLNLLAATRMTRVARIPMLALDRHLGFSSLTWVVVHIPIAAAYWVWAHQNTVEEIRAFRTCTTGIIQPTVASGKFAVTIFQNALWRFETAFLVARTIMFNGHARCCSKTGIGICHAIATANGLKSLGTCWSGVGLCVDMIYFHIFHISRRRENWMASCKSNRNGKAEQ